MEICTLFMLKTTSDKTVDRNELERNGLHHSKGLH